MTDEKVHLNTDKDNWPTYVSQSLIVSQYKMNDNCNWPTYTAYLR
jgi:hypothetical protein